MKIYITKKTNITKTYRDGKQYYVTTIPIRIEQAYYLLEHSRAYVLGKEIAYSNALALMRVIKQTTKYTVLLKAYIPQIPGKAEKVIVEVHASGFPKITLHVSPSVIEPVFDKTINERIKLLEAYIPRKKNEKYIKSTNKKDNGGGSERPYKRHRRSGFQKR